MKLMMVGDTHGNTRSLMHSIKVAGDHNIQHLLVLGDFGLWDHFLDGVAFLDDINEYAQANALTVYAIGGNHENWDHWNWYVENMPKGGKGWAMVRRRVALAPRIHTWKWDNTRFLGIGGAVSIDKEYRLQAEAQRSGPKTLFWPNEEFTDEDVASVEKMDVENGFHPDVLVSHDCSTYTPFRERLKPDLDSQIHRQRIDRVLKHTKPDFHFHGHMHTKYDWINTMVHGFQHGTQTYGLECDGMWNNYGIFDTETKEFTWRPESKKVVKGSPLAPVDDDF
jgi:Icc-related predicted phosphoesterase